MRAGRRLFERFGAPPLGAFVFTVPAELRGAIGVEQAEHLRALVASVVMSWAAHRWNVRTGPIVCFHPTGDRCPACGWHKGSRCEFTGELHRGSACRDRTVNGERVRGCGWKRGENPLESEPAMGIRGSCPKCHAPAQWLPHFDVLLPLVGVANDLRKVDDAGAVVDAGTLRPIHWTLPPEALADLKRRWAALVWRICLRAGVVLQDEAARVLSEGKGGVDYRFMLTKRRKLHRFGYSARPFPAYAHLGRLMTYRGYGLAGPNAAGAEAWRAAVSTEREKPGLLCDCCQIPQPLQAIDVCREFTSRFRLWRWARLHSSCGPP